MYRVVCPGLCGLETDLVNRPLGNLLLWNLSDYRVYVLQAKVVRPWLRSEDILARHTPVPLLLQYASNEGRVRS